MADNILPQGLDGRDWKILQSSNQEVSIDLKQHIAVAVPAVTQGLEQAHYHELARIMFSVGHEPNVNTHAGILAQSIEELRLDLLLEERGIPQDKRLEDHDWSLAPRFDSSTEKRDRLRFLLETVWQAQEVDGPLTGHWRNTFDDVKSGDPELINVLKDAVPQLQQAIKQGSDGLAERDDLANRLQKLLEPPPPPPKPVTPQKLSSETQHKIEEAAKKPEPPAEPAPPKKPTRLRKIEKPQPELKPAEEEEEAATSEPDDEQPSNNDSQTTQEGESSDGNGSANQSEANDGAADDAEEEDGEEEASQPSGESDEDGSEEEDAELDEDGEERSSGSSEEVEDEDDGDGEESESGEEEKDYGAEYEEVEETSEERAEREQQEAADKELAQELRSNGESAIQLYDPQQPHGVGGDAKIGHMLIHSHVKTSHKTRMVRKTAGARDRGVIPTQFHRYAMDRAVFSAKRPGGTILIDGSGSMNWDPNKLEVLISQLPTATVALYHGSEVDWEVTSGLDTTLRSAANLAAAAWRTYATYGRDGSAPYDYDTEMQLKVEAVRTHDKWTRAARGAGYTPLGDLWVAGIKRESGEINGTLCVLGKQGRWGPLAHGLGGGNDVDVEALQWLAAQPGPRVWISDGRVTGGFYHAIVGHSGLERICAELCHRHRITRAPAVKDALKVLRVSIPSLVKLGI